MTADAEDTTGAADNAAETGMTDTVDMAFSFGRLNRYGSQSDGQAS